MADRLRATMLGVELPGNERVVVQEYPRPEPRGDWVLVSVGAALLCGSEAGAYRGPGYRGVPGNEFAGRVVAVDRPARLRPGERVFVYPIWGCGRCALCAAGDVRWCPERRFLGRGAYDGAYAEYALGDRYHIPCQDRHTDAAALLAREDVDAVDVCTGPAGAAALVPQAARAGKHVFAEKPMAPTAAQAETLAHAVRAAGVVYQIGFMKRCYYAYRQARHLLDTGELGRVTGLYCRWFTGYGEDYEARGPHPGGWLHDGAVHIFDLVQFFLGPAVEVYAQRCSAEGGSTFTLSLRGVDGAPGLVLLTSFGGWNFPNEHLELTGSRHRVLVAENGQRLWLYRKEGNPRAPLQPAPAQYWEPTISVSSIQGNEIAGWTLQFRHFTACILQGKQPLAGVAEGVQAQRLHEGVLRSLAEQRPVPIEVFA